MIKIIDDKNQIRDLHKSLNDSLNRYFTEIIDCYVGYPSGSFRTKVKYSPELNIWLANHIEEKKYWNGFGIGKPREHKGNSLIGEINYPVNGKGRVYAGAFGIEDNGNILLLHRGKIGGGTKGIGKYFFNDNFRGDFVDAIDAGREEKLCLVGELKSEHFPQQIANFIYEINRVKQLIKNPTSSDFAYLNNFNYSQEHSGSSVIDKKGKSIINRTHGLVVTELANQLERHGFNIGNDRNRDLFTFKNGKINNLFEIKTSSKTQDLYTGIGQLLIYSIPIDNKVNLHLIVPDELNKKVSFRLKELNINVIYYIWENGNPIFPDLIEKIK